MFYKKILFKSMVLITLCFMVSMTATSVSAQPEIEMPSTIADLEFANLAQRLQTDLYYSGSWIEHVPEYRFYVGFTSSDYQERLEPYLSGMTHADKVVALQREYTLSELREARRQVDDLLVPKYMAGEIPYYRDNLSRRENRVLIKTSEPDTVRSMVESDDTLVSFQGMMTYVYSPDGFAWPDINESDTTTYLFLPIVSK